MDRPSTSIIDPALAAHADDPPDAVREKTSGYGTVVVGCAREAITRLRAASVSNPTSGDGHLGERVDPSAVDSTLANVYKHPAPELCQKRSTIGSTERR
jgi:hypothetical protein